MIGNKFLKEKIKNVRKIILDTAYRNQLSHLSSCLSCAEILVNLFFGCMEEKDKFILSKGHAGLALYAVLLEKGILKEIDYRKLKTHPEKDLELGIEFTTGSLGQGLPVGCGLAMADRDRKVYVLLSEGDCDEGSTWETAKIAVDNKLSNLIAIVDANGWQCYRKAESSTSLAKKWRGFGWKVFRLSQKEGKMNFKRFRSAPTAYIVDTVKGKGLPSIENTLESHYYKINTKDYEKSTG